MVGPDVPACVESPLANSLLARLPAVFQARLVPVLEPVSWVARTPFADATESTDATAYVYFPVRAIISLRRRTADGSSAEVALVGSDGCFAPAHDGPDSARDLRAVIAVGGSAYRLKSALLRHDPALQIALRQAGAGHALGLAAQISQTTHCNQDHSVQQRLCRHLLMHLDQLAPRQLTTTQTMIAQALGLRAALLTETVKRLRVAGIISRDHSYISVLSRTGLTDRCCECYRILADETRRVSSSPTDVASAPERYLPRSEPALRSPSGR